MPLTTQDDMLQDSRQAGISIYEAHSRAQSLLQEIDLGMEIGYSEVVDRIFALAYGVSPVMRAIHGDIACEKSDIFVRISRIAASSNM